MVGTVSPPPPATGVITNRVAHTSTNRVTVAEVAFELGKFPRPPLNNFELQLALARAGISSGSLDGVVGSQTRAAIRAFQLRERLTATGVADDATKSRLLLTSSPVTNYIVSMNDLTRLQPLSTTWLGKSQQSALDYETVLELVAERAHAHPALIKQLNPTVDWTNVTAGMELRIPNVSYPTPRGRAAFVLIHLADKSLQAFDSNTNLMLELVAERAHAHPALIKQLNPTVDWTNVTAGMELRIPNVSYPTPRGRAAFVLIHLADKSLQAFDSNTNLIVHFPCSIAARIEKRPVGELFVAVVALNPNYTFDPEVFPESTEARQIGRKLMLPPGPNNPVGVAWIGLDRPGYGIHGTPAPEQVGRTESHGCFRLANWNAEQLLKLVTTGTPIRVIE